MQINLIRHAQTQGNIERRFLGRTDEPLSEAGIACFCNLAYPLAGRVYASPMLRCLQTARILYPMEQPHILEGLREYDFGDFENKSHHELEALPAYRAWLASGCRTTPPHGEELHAFQARCCEAFAGAVEESFADGLCSVSFVIHGGTIMAVMEHFVPGEKTFYDWQSPNLGGWTVEADFSAQKALCRLTNIQPIQHGGE